MLIECPSGLTGNIRALKGKEVRIFAEHRKAPGKVKPWAVLTKLIDTCWESTEDPGPYSVGDDGKLDWNKVLEGDRTYAFVALRSLTFGAEYVFRVGCTTCKGWIDWRIGDLLQDLPVRRLADADRKAFTSGNRFETTFPRTEQKVWFRLPVGEDGRAVAAIANADDSYVQSVLLSVIEIEGVPRADTKKFLDEAVLGDLVTLGKRFEEHDCGVETKFDVVCQACGCPQETVLPFGKEFWPLN